MFIRQIKVINIIIIVIITEWPPSYKKDESSMTNQICSEFERAPAHNRRRFSTREGHGEGWQGGKGEGENCRCALRIPEMGCGGRFKWSPVEWIILFHGGANTSVTATRILSGLGIRISRIRWRGRAPNVPLVPALNVKLFRESRPPEKSSMRRTRPRSESRMRRFSVVRDNRPRADLRPSWALSVNE